MIRAGDQSPSTRNDIPDKVFRDQFQLPQRPSAYLSLQMESLTQQHRKYIAQTLKSQDSSSLIQRIDEIDTMIEDNICRIFEKRHFNFLVIVAILEEYKKNIQFQPQLVLQMTCEMIIKWVDSVSNSQYQGIFGEYQNNRMVKRNIIKRFLFLAFEMVGVLMVKKEGVEGKKDDRGRGKKRGKGKGNGMMETSQKYLNTLTVVISQTLFMIDFESIWPEGIEYEFLRCYIITANRLIGEEITKDIKMREVVCQLLDGVIYRWPGAVEKIADEMIESICSDEKMGQIYSSFFFMADSMYVKELFEKVLMTLLKIIIFSNNHLKARSDSKEQSTKQHTGQGNEQEPDDQQVSESSQRNPEEKKMARKPRRKPRKQGERNKESSQEQNSEGDQQHQVGGNRRKIQSTLRHICYFLNQITTKHFEFFYNHLSSFACLTQSPYYFFRKLMLDVIQSVYEKAQNQPKSQQTNYKLQLIQQILLQSFHDQQQFVRSYIQEIIQNMIKKNYFSASFLEKVCFSLIVSMEDVSKVVRKRSFNSMQECFNKLFGHYGIERIKPESECRVGINELEFVNQGLRDEIESMIREMEDDNQEIQNEMDHYLLQIDHNESQIRKHQSYIRIQKLFQASLEVLNRLLETQQEDDQISQCANLVLYYHTRGAQNISSTTDILYKRIVNNSEKTEDKSMKIIFSIFYKIEIGEVKGCSAKLIRLYVQGKDESMLKILDRFLLMMMNRAENSYECQIQGIKIWDRLAELLNIVDPSIEQQHQTSRVMRLLTAIFDIEFENMLDDHLYFAVINLEMAQTKRLSKQAVLFLLRMVGLRLDELKSQIGSRVFRQLFLLYHYICQLPISDFYQILPQIFSTVSAYQTYKNSHSQSQLDDSINIEDEMIVFLISKLKENLLRNKSSPVALRHCMAEYQIKMDALLGMYIEKFGAFMDYYNQFAELVWTLIEDKHFENFTMKNTFMEPLFDPFIHFLPDDYQTHQISEQKMAEYLEDSEKYGGIVADFVLQQESLYYKTLPNQTLQQLFQQDENEESPDYYEKQKFLLKLFSRKSISQQKMGKGRWMKKQYIEFTKRAIQGVGKMIDDKCQILIPEQLSLKNMFRILCYLPTSQKFFSRYLDKVIRVSNKYNQFNIKICSIQGFYALALNEKIRNEDRKKIILQLNNFLFDEDERVRKPTLNLVELIYNRYPEITLDQLYIFYGLADNEVYKREKDFVRSLFKERKDGIQILIKIISLLYVFEKVGTKFLRFTVQENSYEIIAQDVIPLTLEKDKIYNMNTLVKELSNRIRLSDSRLVVKNCCLTMSLLDLSLFSLDSLVWDHEFIQDKVNNPDCIPYFANIIDKIRSNPEKMDPLMTDTLPYFQACFVHQKTRQEFQKEVQSHGPLYFYLKTKQDEMKRRGRRPNLKQVRAENQQVQPSSESLPQQSSSQQLSNIRAWSDNVEDSNEVREGLERGKAAMQEIKRVGVRNDRSNINRDMVEDSSESSDNEEYQRKKVNVRARRGRE